MSTVLSKKLKDLNMVETVQNHVENRELATQSACLLIGKCFSIQQIDMKSLIEVLGIQVRELRYVKVKNSVSLQRIKKKVGEKFI